MIQHKAIKDITHANEFISVNFELPFQVSAAICLMQSGDSVTQKIKLCMQDLLCRLNQVYPESQLFLIAGHNVNQDDNRITRFNRFWKSLKRRNIEIPEGIFYDELFFEYKNGIRYCATMKFKIDQIDKVISIMKDSLSLVILSEIGNPDFILNEIAQKWFGNSENLIVNLIQPTLGILNFFDKYPIIGINTYGDFDDYEVYVAAVAKEELLQKIIQRFDAS